MTSHTPGPWTIKDTDKIISKDRFVIECKTNIPRIQEPLPWAEKARVLLRKANNEDLLPLIIASIIYLISAIHILLLPGRRAFGGSPCIAPT